MLWCCGLTSRNNLAQWEGFVAAPASGGSGQKPRHESQGLQKELSGGLGYDPRPRGWPAWAQRSRHDARGALTRRSAPIVNLGRGTSQNQTRQRSRGCPHSFPREGCKKKAGSGERQKRETQAGCRTTPKATSTKSFKQRKTSQLQKANEKPRPSPNLVFDVFSPARS